MVKRTIDKPTMADVAARAEYRGDRLFRAGENNPAVDQRGGPRRVIEAARELDFHRRANAVTLARGRSGNIALVLPAI
jgi:DNA-binding LacI/PurR family transcriptional regulator